MLKSGLTLLTLPIHFSQAALGGKRMMAAIYRHTFVGLLELGLRREVRHDGDGIG